MENTDFCKKCGTEKIYLPGNKYKICPKCRRRTNQNHYNRNRQRRNTQLNENRNKRVRSKRFRVLEYLSEHPCVDCGETNPVFLEFDHLRDKNFCIANKMQQHSWEKIQTEIEKCEVRCLKCHRLKTIQDHNWYSWINDQSVIDELRQQHPNIDYTLTHPAILELMMTLNNSEKLVLEAVDSMLQHDAKLGLAMHDKEHEKTGSAERGYEYLHGQIDEMFAVKAAELDYADGICQAFKKVHNYKYVDDPTFKTAMEKEMVAQAIPEADRGKALDFVPAIINELKKEQSEWAEKDLYKRDLSEIQEVSQPEQPLDFQIEEVDGWPKDANVEFDEGDASPGKTPSDSEHSMPK